MRVVFLDTETTGLDIERHEMWEFAAIIYDSEHWEFEADCEYMWWPTHLEDADPNALRVGKFYERNVPDSMEDPWDIAKRIAYVLHGALIVANNPGFDEKFIEKFLRSQSFTLTSFHRKVNVVDLAMGYLQGKEAFSGLTPEEHEALEFPHSSRKVLDAAGCPPNQNPHTALGDAAHVRDAFFHLIGKGLT